MSARTRSRIAVQWLPVVLFLGFVAVAAIDTHATAANKPPVIANISAGGLAAIAPATAPHPASAAQAERAPQPIVIAALAAIVAIPVLLEIMERVFSVSLRMTPWAVAQIMLKTVLLPLAIGMSVRALWPKFAARLSGPALAFAAAVLTVPFNVTTLLSTSTSISLSSSTVFQSARYCA